MFNSTALDVFIGLVFIFLLYSLLATIVQELIAVKFAFRSKVLERAILRMLEDGKTSSNSKVKDRITGFLNMFFKPNHLKDKAVAPWFYAHPLIKYLGENNYYSKPAYITAQNFSKVLIDLLKGVDEAAGSDVQRINSSIQNKTIFQYPVNLKSDPENPAIKAIVEQHKNNKAIDDPIDALDTIKVNQDTSLFLLSLWQDSGADVEKFKLKLEQWFDDTMDRATGWYKRYTQTVLLVIGFAMAVIFNVDTIAIHRILSKDKTAREQLVQMAITNKDKIGGIVNNMPTTDSLLTNTYSIVAQDANAANEVMGLGRPWKDSCKACEAIYKDKKFNTSFKKKIDSFNQMRLAVNSLQKRSGIFKIKLDSVTALTTAAATDKVRLAKLTAEESKFKADKADADAKLAKFDQKSIADSLKKLTPLVTRCPYILHESETLFKYSPNQRGGLETFFGWLLTALAISLGAPFWFDMLNKLIKLRGAGTKATSGNDAAATGSAASTALTTAPVTVNVNPNPGEEAVG